MNQSQVAKKYKITRQAVGKAVKSGRVRMEGKNVNQVDVERVWGDGKRDNGSKYKDYDLNKEKLRVEIDLKKQEYRKRKGELVPVSEVYRMINAHYSILRNNLTNYPDKLFLLLIKSKIDKSIAIEVKNGSKKMIDESMNKILDLMEKDESDQEN